jgi:DNA sulfur modification protein DndD
MIISKIVIDNFRQYYGKNTIDELLPTNERNIILIGGKNGYGKTNFLLSLVWCLYGEDISKIDDSYRHEIQKEGNYSKFLKGSLNWEASRNDKTKFSVEMNLTNIEIPAVYESQSRSDVICRIKREYDVITSVEEFDIKLEGVPNSFLRNNEDKINFINDYVIPLEAAKFVFFDAEKIASWAELSTREEGNVLNDALGKILGLDIYDSLVNDLQIYTDGLRKESATSQVKQQIISTEKGIQLNTERIGDIENQIIAKEFNISKLKADLNKYEVFLLNNSRNKEKGEALSIEGLYKKLTECKQKEISIQDKFSELNEVMPLAIVAGKIEEVINYLNIQDHYNDDKEREKEISDKSIELIEKLFNTPPFPEDGDISFSKKMFYADKAKYVLEEIFGQKKAEEELTFEHDLNKSDRDLIKETYAYIRLQSKDIFELTYNNYNSIKEEISHLERLIKNTESDLEDEEVAEYAGKKTDTERKIEKLLEEKGYLINQKELLKRENEKLALSLQILIKRINVSEQKKLKLDTAYKYIDALEGFIRSQKVSKCVQLETLVFQEMQLLMHKFRNDADHNFIAGVKAEALPDNDGLKIVLYDKFGGVRSKEALSQGEKQIYISSLIKAILSLSILEYPIFIDTPLGRLDDEHIKHILLYYYPDLANQVVLLATNNEIPPSRLKLVSDNIAHTYLLDSYNGKTKFKKGYFKSYED